MKIFAFILFTVAAVVPPSQSTYVDRGMIGKCGDFEEMLKSYRPGESFRCNDERAVWTCRAMSTGYSCNASVNKYQEDYRARPDFNTIFQNSFILGNSKEDIEFLTGVLPQRKVETTLLYRGTRDGWSAAAFHSRCDNMGPTLTLVQTENKFRLGGFTSVNWDISETFAYDPTAFLFSLNGYLSWRI